MKKWILLTIFMLNCFSFSYASHSWNGRIFQVSTQKEISAAELMTGISKAHTVILGENHNVPAIQLAQSTIINQVVNATHQQENFIIAWEFLNYTDQEKINALYAQFLSGKIDAKKFLIETQGSIHNESYIPILETTKTLQGKILGVNISREAKESVIKGGISALDPKLLPPDFAMGSAGYHQRFIEIMEGHTPKEKIENYYAAQCLTDDVMAYTLQKFFTAPLLFLITGSFHTDYFDGVVNRINIRFTDKSVAVVRFIDASDYDQEEIQESLSEILHDKTYGNISDFVYFVNEPS